MTITERSSSLARLTVSGTRIADFFAASKIGASIFTRPYSRFCAAKRSSRKMAKAKIALAIYGCSILVGLAFLTISVHAQSPSPEAAEIAHCLRVGDPNWLSDSPVLSQEEWLHIGLRHDRKTYPGVDMITVVVFETRNKGDVFEVVREGSARHRIYRVVNNGSIDPGRQGLAWVGDVLWGIWTRQYIARNVREVMHNPKTWISVKTALQPMPRVSCTSYQDN